MHRQFLSFLVSISLCLCGGCTLYHPQALRPLYDQLKLGENVPSDWKQPPNATNSADGPLHAVCLDRQWGNGCGAFEAIVYMQDDRGRVAAKRYCVDAEDMSLALGIYSTLDRSEWAMSVSGKENPAAIQAMCDRLSSVHLPDSFGGAADDKPPDKKFHGDLSAGPVCQAAQKAGWNPADRKGYSRDSSWSEDSLGAMRRKLNWNINVIRSGEVEVVREHRTDISIAGVTVEGYQYMLSTGKLPY
jgi:hypothetical protein